MEKHNKKQAEKYVSLLTEKSEKLLDLFLKKVRLTEANAPKCFPLSIFNCYLIARAQVTDFWTVVQKFEQISALKTISRDWKSWLSGWFSGFL